MKILEVADYFILPHVSQLKAEEGDAQYIAYLRKARMCVLGSFILGGLTFIMGLIRFLVQYPDYSKTLIFLPVLGIFDISLPWFYRKTGRLEVVVNFLVYMGALVILVRTFKTGGFYGMPVAWFTLVPLGAGLLAGSRAIIGALIVTILMILFAYFGPRFGLPITGLKPELPNMIVLIILVMAHAFISLTFERQREKQVNALQESHQKLSETKKLLSLGTLAAGVAHEVNNPLTIIKGNIRNLAKILSGKEIPDEVHVQVHKRIEKVEENIERIHKIVHSLLTYTTLNKTEENKTFHLSEVFKNIESQLAANPLSHYISWPAQEDIPFQELVGDQILIEQVMTNLFQNSLYAIRELDEKFIKVSIEENSDSIVFEVQDSGTIEDQKVLDNLFTPFFTTKIIGEGSGLGLSLCQGIIEMHGGKLELASPKPYTTFKFSLPITHNEPE